MGRRALRQFFRRPPRRYALRPDSGEVALRVDRYEPRHCGQVRSADIEIALAQQRRNLAAMVGLMVEEVRDRYPVLAASRLRRADDAYVSQA
jgi:hypothetical protein